MELTPENKKVLNPDEICIEICDVIGNIHQNADLL